MIKFFKKKRKVNNVYEALLCQLKEKSLKIQCQFVKAQIKYSRK